MRRLPQEAFEALKEKFGVNSDDYKEAISEQQKEHGVDDDDCGQLKSVREELERHIAAKRKQDEQERKEMRRKLRAYSREIRREAREWEMLGWGYKPRLHDPKNTVAHKPVNQWHRIRANPKLR